MIEGEAQDICIAEIMVSHEILERRLANRQPENASLATRWVPLQRRPRLHSFRQRLPHAFVLPREKDRGAAGYRARTFVNRKQKFFFFPDIC